MKTTPTSEVSLPVSDFYMLPLSGDQDLEALEYLLTDTTHFANLVSVNVNFSKNNFFLQWL